MLTVDFERLGLRPGDVVLDLGSGPGRHSFEALRRGARVVALDLDRDDLGKAAAMFAAMGTAGQVPLGGAGAPVNADALALPFADGAFDRVIASEVLEHIPGDEAAMEELSRVLKAGGTMAVTVPRWFPERVCWALSREYHEVERGHIRIYRAGELLARLRGAGLELLGSHHAHALHSPYWWLRCLLGDSAPPRLYHRFLVWDITRRPTVTRLLERGLNPVLGKSLVVYVRKPAAGARIARAAA